MSSSQPVDTFDILTKDGVVVATVQGRFLEKKGFVELIQKPRPGGKGVYYVCPKCNEHFPTYKKLKHHRKDVHAY